MGDRDALLEVSDVRKTYGERVVTEVLKGIDLELKRGEFCALTGPSGSGKTTLLNLIGLLDRPTSGRIVLDGQSTDPLTDVERTDLRGSELGFVFQFHHLLPAFSAHENVMMPLVSRHGRPARWMRERASALLDEVGLSHREHYKSTDLSGGEQQRVAIARALAVQPQLVLADEPTGNLDSESAEQVMQLLHRFNERSETGFLIVTHEASIADQCRRIVHMIDGVIDSDTGDAQRPRTAAAPLESL
ncbi:MAG: ABC transporter ATP-binding protein [Gemmatimonadetes bacterium]|nr:ABC transporter ATP-binding protein [Gemmatimonadota bacterium]MBT8462530.1 ABC transporter ATP-binding protein [Gemmatimonadota bacterium]NNK63613.1 ABC transporter ATP-binding protein [Gemmatimonadota bacterium]